METTKNYSSENNRMDDAYDIAIKLLGTRLNNDQKENVRALNPTDIYIVPGAYDSVEKVLGKMKIPFTIIDQPRVDLSKSKFLIVNCPGNWLEGKKEQIRKFVRNGGFLITTDWAVEPLEDIYPDKIKKNGASTHDECISLDQPNVSPDEDNRNDIAPVWWLEGSSYPFTVQNDVEVLLSSAELFRKYGSGVVAATWKHGKGKVLHMISHYYLQKSELRDEKAKSSFSSVSTDYGFSEEVLKKTGTFEKGQNLESGLFNSAYSSAEILLSTLSRNSDQKENE